MRYLEYSPVTRLASPEDDGYSFAGFAELTVTSSPFRVIVVDDFDPWRDFVRSTLKEHAQSWVVSEASDGLEAVRKAHELQPGLVILDIGLPKLHGIEAARRIRNKCPEAKLLFLTERHSVEIIQEAFRAGANGYIAKSDAVDLLAAIEAIRQDRIFLSKSLQASALDITDRDSGRSES